MPAFCSNLRSMPLMHRPAMLAGLAVALVVILPNRAASQEPGGLTPRSRDEALSFLHPANVRWAKCNGGTIESHDRYDASGIWLFGEVRTNVFTVDQEFDLSFQITGTSRWLVELFVVDDGKQNGIIELKREIYGTYGKSKLERGGVVQLPSGSQNGQVQFQFEPGNIKVIVGTGTFNDELDPMWSKYMVQVTVYNSAGRINDLVMLPIHEAYALDHLLQGALIAREGPESGCMSGAPCGGKCWGVGLSTGYCMCYPDGYIGESGNPHPTSCMFSPGDGPGTSVEAPARDQKGYRAYPSDAHTDL